MQASKIYHGPSSNDPAVTILAFADDTTEFVISSLEGEYCIIYQGRSYMGGILGYALQNGWLGLRIDPICSYELGLEREIEFEFDREFSQTVLVFLQSRVVSVK